MYVLLKSAENGTLTEEKWQPSILSLVWRAKQELAPKLCNTKMTRHSKLLAVPTTWLGIPLSDIHCTWRNTY